MDSLLTAQDEPVLLGDKVYFKPCALFLHNSVIITLSGWIFEEKNAMLSP